LSRLENPIGYPAFHHLILQILKAANRMRDVNKFLSEMRAGSSEEVAAMWARVEDLYTKKLWHQLTLQLEALVKEPSMQDKLVHIYTEFIADFEAKMDPLKLTQMAMVVVAKYTDPQEAIAFVERVQDKVKLNNEALCLCKVNRLNMALYLFAGPPQVLVGRVRLHKLKQEKETKAIIEEVESLLDHYDGVSPVHSHFYLLASDLYRLQVIRRTMIINMIIMISEHMISRAIMMNPAGKACPVLPGLPALPGLHRRVLPEQGGVGPVRLLPRPRRPARRGSLQLRGAPRARGAEGA
jgi:hypothetical protein